jgi:hypothetical protein
LLNCYTFATITLAAQDVALFKEIKMTTLNINQNSKTGKVFTKLVLNGETLTEAQARKLGVGNLRAEVSRIRQTGTAIYANKRVAANGITVTEYRHGKPSRALIAAGYRALAAGI